jgi:thiamine-phosphate diphosphorylase / hydroxyethylthiazole kinase
LCCYILIITIGATIVQFRDKQSGTRKLIEEGKKLHELTQKYNVPLIVNDRVDVAFAIGAEGVHIGQDDMGKLDFCIKISGLHQ